jgi:hypothetical protein
MALENKWRIVRSSAGIPAAMAAPNRFASVLLRQAFADLFQARFCAGFHSGLHGRSIFFLATGGLESLDLII